MQCRRLEERLRVLSEATQAFADATTDTQRLLDTVARRISEVVKDYCVVRLLSDDGTALVPAAAFDSDPDALRQMREVLAAEPFPLEAHHVARRIVETGEPFLAARLDLELLRPPRTTPRFFAFMQRMKIHSILVVSLRAHDRCIGQLTLARFRAESPPFDENDLVLAQSLAAHAALAISNARLVAELRKEGEARTRVADRMRVLSEASREFSAATYDYDHLLDVVARRLGEIVGDMCAVRVTSADGEWIESTGATYHRDPELRGTMREVMSMARQRVGEGVSGRVVATGQPIITKLESSEPRYHPFLERLGVTNAITLPLICRGEVVGIANLMRGGRADPYDEDDLRMVQSIADHAALAIGNARLFAAERVARETAERATAERAVAQARFGRLAESGILGVLVNDLNGVVYEVNDALLALVGYSREEILSGRVAWPSLTPPEWAAVDAKAREHIEATGIGGLREKEYLRKDGTRVPVLVGSALLERTSGECISFVLDLTERKTAERTLEHLRVESAADARLGAIVGASDDAIVGKTLDGVVTSWNEGARKVFGYSADEIVGKSIAILIPPGREDEEASILHSLARGEVKRFDTVRRRKDGRDIDVSVTTSPIRGADGHIVGISKVARDITDRRRNEEALARAKDIAESASRELEAFSYSVAHDLRAPLRGMNGFAHVLLDAYGEKFDAEGRDWLNEIVLNAKRMGELIDALLSLSRVTRAELRRESVDLSAIVRAAGGELSASHEDRRVELVVEDGLRADIDPTLARALVENLLGNAWKFTKHVPAARVEFGATARDGARAFFVRDNGAGFDMAYGNKLFAPFQRLHSNAEFPGTGIGLATVQRIVSRHGGRVWAEGEVDRGATFFFSVPDGRSGATH